MMAKCYEPISKHTFRVLRVSQVHPSVVGELIQRPFLEPPEYHAVSYAWGTQTASKKIACNGEDLYVTPHLHEAIKSIIHVQGFHDIWIDAICINQEDDIEKAQQVSMMSHIYKQATKVYVWLGEAEDESDTVCDFINSHSQSILAQTIPEFLRPRLDIEDGNVLNYLTESLIQPIWAFCMRSWFTRLWTVQEVILARHLEFICGEKRIDGEVLLRFAINMVQGNFVHRALVVFQIPLAGDLEGFGGLGPVFKWRKPSSVSDRLTKFATCVEWCRAKETKEPVDRIYGLLSLCDVDDVYSKGIAIDYSQSNRANYWEVYIQFGKLALIHEPDLYLLETTTSLNRPQEVPSWCPNFHSKRLEPSRIAKYFAGWPATNHTCDQSKHPSFKHQTKSYVTINPHSPEIQIQGSIMDTIVEVADRFNFRVPSFQGDCLGPLKQFAHSTLSWLSDLKDMTRHTYRSGDETPEPLWRTLVGDTDYTPRGRTWPCNPERKQQLANFQKYLQLLYADLHGLGEGVSVSQAANFEAQNKRSIEEFSATLGRIWPGRVFFTTKNGRIGFASRDAKVGDVVCAFYSGPSIYILRQTSTTQNPVYNFVSIGYTHGLMGGEAFDLLDQGVTKEQTFIII